MNKISFVIPMIHEFPSIYGTINNIQTEMNDSVYDYEIIVAENGTVDPNTPNFQRLYRAIIRKGLVKYIFEPRQCGPIARNAGAKIASGEFVIFMDAHTTLGKDSIEPLVDYLLDHPECGSISGLTAWSHYDLARLGSYYELFHTKEKMEAFKGGPTLVSHMHGHYMPLGRVKDKSILQKKTPFRAVMGSQAYTMYRLEEFLDIGGYFEGCRFYPHPEGYMPLKFWMTGKEVVIHPGSYHIHGMYPRSYRQTNQTKIIELINGVLSMEVDDATKVLRVKESLMYSQPDEGVSKIKEYGGWSWSEHGTCNIMKIAYILGGEKWLGLCYGTLVKKHGIRRLPQLRDLAVQVVEESDEKNRLLNQQEMTLDEVLTWARKEHIPGMEHWYDPIGPDPLL